MDINQIKASDTKEYRERNNLATTNANLFISNNANPFLISPYSPPANLVKQPQINNINVVISSILGNLSSVININTYTLSISTITNIPSSDTITLSTTNLIVDATNLEVNATTYFNQNTYFNSISTGYIDASVANISSLQVSSIVAINENINNLTVNNQLNASNISTGNLFASNGSISSLQVSSIVAINENIEYLTVNNQLNASNISTGTLNTASFIFSSLCMIPPAFSTAVTPTSSILLCMNGEWWGIPVGKF